MIESLELETYADESGIKSTRYCAVSGLVGTSKHWRIAEDHWKDACGDLVFHAKEFFGRDPQGHRVGIYKNWSDEKAQKFLKKLFDAITFRPFTIVGGFNDVKAFNALSHAERRYLTLAKFDPRITAWRSTGAPSKPWFLGFAATIVESALCVKRPGLKINFWFDRQNEYEGLANLLFQEACSPRAMPPLSKALGNLVFAPKNDYPGIQMADLIAYTGVSVNENGGPKHAEQEYAMHRIQAIPKQKVMNYTADQLQKSLRGVPPHLRAKWHTTKQRGPRRRRGNQ